LTGQSNQKQSEVPYNGYTVHSKITDAWFNWRVHSVIGHVDAGTENPAPTKNLVYCNQCRFLRRQFDESEEGPLETFRHICVHPSNITCFRSAIERVGLGYRSFPDRINADNDCQCFQSVNDVIGKLNIEEYKFI